MSTEVTPDLLRTVAAAWEGGTASDDYARHELRSRADQLEREQRPLLTVPGWYPNVVVERGGESCTGVQRNDEGGWFTSVRLGDRYVHFPSDRDTTIRWAEQDGTTPGQKVYETWTKPYGFFPWSGISLETRDRYERAAAAVLAAHGTPRLNPVGEHPEPGTRGLLPVVVNEGDEWVFYCGPDIIYVCEAGSKTGSIVLADPRPDGAP